MCLFLSALDDSCVMCTIIDYRQIAVERVFERGTECLVHVIALKKKTEECREKGSETKLYRKEVKRGV